MMQNQSEWRKQFMKTLSYFLLNIAPKVKLFIKQIEITAEPTDIFTKISVHVTY